MKKRRKDTVKSDIYVNFTNLDSNGAGIILNKTDYAKLSDH